jgi:hypothetical protein
VTSDRGKPPRQLQAGVEPDDQAPDQGRLRIVQVHLKELARRDGGDHHALRCELVKVEVSNVEIQAVDFN